MKQALLLLSLIYLLRPLIDAEDLQGTVIDELQNTIANVQITLQYADFLKPEYPFQLFTHSDKSGAFIFKGLQPSKQNDFRIFASYKKLSLALKTSNRVMGQSVEHLDKRLLLTLQPAHDIYVQFKMPKNQNKELNKNQIELHGVMNIDEDNAWFPLSKDENILRELPFRKVGVKYQTALNGQGTFFIQPDSLGAKDTLIYLEAKEWIEGRVLDSMGLPIPGVLYKTENAFRLLGLTDSGGVFRIQKPRHGGVTLLLRHFDYKDTVFSTETFPLTRPLAITLARGKIVQTHLTNYTSDFLRSCQMQARPLEFDSNFAKWKFPGGSTRRAIADSSGQFFMAGLRDGNYVVKIGCEATETREDTLRPDKNLPEEIVLRKGFKVTYKIQEKINSLLAPTNLTRVSPIVGAKIKVRKVLEKSLLRQGETDSDGQLLFTALPEGNYVILIREAGHIALKQTLHISKDTLIELSLEQGLSINGQVTQSDGSLAQDLRVFALPDSLVKENDKTHFIASEPMVLRQGEWSLTGLPEGLYTLGIAAPWTKTNPFMPLFRVDRIHAGEQNVKIHLPTMRGLSLQPFCGDSASLDTFQIYVLLPSQDSLPRLSLGHAMSQVPMQGEYNVNAFVGIKYIIHMENPKYLTVNELIQIPEGEGRYIKKMALTLKVEKVVELPIANKSILKVNKLH